MAGVSVLTRVRGAGWAVDIDVPTPATNKRMALKFVTERLSRERVEHTVTERGNVFIDVRS